MTFTAIESARAHRCTRSGPGSSSGGSSPPCAPRPHPAGRAAVRLPAGDAHRPRPPASAFHSLRLPRATGAWRAAACALAAAFVLLLGAGAAQAQTAVKLVSNTGQSSAFSGINVDYAQAFTTGSNDAGYAGYKLTRVDLRMSSGGGTTPVYTVSIHSDSSNAPGTSLGTLTQQGSLPSTTGPVRFNASGDGIDLAANTRYWLVLDVSTPNSSAEVRITDAGADAEDSGGAAGWSIADTLIWRSRTSTSAQ